MRDTRRDASLWGWCLLGLLGSTLLPWYALQDGFWGFEWLASFPGKLKPPRPCGC